MVTISILTLKNAVLASIADARHVFTKVNEFLAETGKPALFKIHLAGLSKEIKLNDGLFSIYPDVSLDAVKPDLIIIPAMTGDMLTATHLNRDYAIWISAV